MLLNFSCCVVPRVWGVLCTLLWTLGGPFEQVLGGVRGVCFRYFHVWVLNGCLVGWHKSGWILGFAGMCWAKLQGGGGSRAAGVLVSLG